MMYLWPWLVVLIVCTSLRGAVSCGGKCIGLGSICFIVSSRNEGRDVQEIAEVLEEVEDWEALAGWLAVQHLSLHSVVGESWLRHTVTRLVVILPEL